MLLRPGKLGFFLLFAVVVLVWTSVHERSREVIHSGWKVTTQAFGQGAQVFEQGGSFADDVDVDTDVDVEIVAAEGPSPYAYVFYATQDVYACSVLINIRQLRENLKTKHRIFVMVSHQVSLTYVDALERLNASVSVHTPAALAQGSEGAGYYADCLLKLQGFKMHHIDSSLKRVIVLDSDQMVLKNLDYLFEDQIDVDLAAPRAYWIARETISTAFMMITLSDRLWNTVEKAIKEIKVNEYDMDLVNEVLGETVLMLPGSFVTLNSHWEDWNLPKWFHKKEEQKKNQTEAKKVAVTHMGGVPGSGDLVRRQEEDEVHSPAIDEAASLEKEVEGEDAQSEIETGKVMPVADGITSFDGTMIEDISTDITDGIATMKDPATTEHNPGSPASDTAASELEQGISDDVTSSIQSGNLPPRPITETDPSTMPPAFDPTKHDASSPHYENNIPPTHATTIPLTPHIPDPPLSERKLYKELFELYEQVAVLHFTALGKPWTVNNETLRRDRPEAHPLFAEQFLGWREMAVETCPGGVVGVV